MFPLPPSPVRMSPRAPHPARTSHTEKVFLVPGDPRSLPTIRHKVGDALSGQPCALQEAAVLCADELASNAIRHAGGPFELRVDIAPEALRISVADTNPDLPVVRRVGRMAERGRGLRIVSELAAQWGTAPDRLGKVVWCELPTGDGPSPERPIGQAFGGSF
jgi:anti-sigma regulatory factor (Ser/Thr protein kinase)